MELNISPSTRQSYINAILDCLQSRKYCEAIMDDLLLFTPSKKTHMNKLEDLLKALLKNGLKVSPKFPSTTQRIQVGNGQCVSVLFIIPVIVDIHGHRFEIYT